MDYIHGHWWTQALAAAIEIGLIDALLERPLSFDELTHVTKADPSLLRPFLSALAGSELVTVRGDLILLTEAGRELGPAQPARSLALLNARAYARRALLLPEILLGHQPSMSLWDELVSDGLSGDFFSTMENNTAPISRDLVVALRIPAASVVVDLGAGSGALISAILSENPDAKCVAVERPEYAALLQDRFSGYADRVDVAAMDFRREVPVGDVYILKSVLHNWSDSACRSIFRSIRRANPDAQVMIIERMDSVAEEIASVGAITMISLFGSPERTFGDLEMLLASAGFTEVEVTELDPHLMLRVLRVRG